MGTTHHSLKASKSTRYNKNRPTYDLVSPSRLKKYDFKPKNKSTMLSNLKEKISVKHSSLSQQLQNNSKRSSTKNSTPLKSGLNKKKRKKKTNSKRERFMAVTNPMKFQQYKQEKLSSNLRPNKKNKNKQQKSILGNNKLYSQSNFLKGTSGNNGYFSSKRNNIQENTQSRSIQLRSGGMSYKKKPDGMSKVKKYKRKAQRDSIYEKILHGNGDNNEKSRSRSKKEENLSLRSYVKETIYEEKKDEVKESNYYGFKKKYILTENSSKTEQKSVELISKNEKHHIRTYGSHMLK